MNDRINELKALIETMDPASPLRKSLEDALEAELKRVAETDQPPHENSQDDAQEDTRKDTQNTTEASQPSSGILDDIADKLDELLDDDEFITASAGFLLGAVTVGAGALVISALRKCS